MFLKLFFPFSFFFWRASGDLSPEDEGRVLRFGVLER